jgi:carboxypeptidase family protein
VLALIVAISLGQTVPAAQPAGARLAGRVTVEGTNAPLADARIVLVPAGRVMIQPFGPPPQTTTDQDGRFAFAGLRPGEYRINVERTGYAPLDEPGRGRTVQLAEGQSIEDLQLQLQKGAVIAGRILAPSGEPEPDVRVIALRRLEGPRTLPRLVPAPMLGLQQTNDLGEFRISGLAPGEYYLSATPRQSPPFGGPAVATAPATAGASQMTLATTFYPGTTDQAAAQPIAVARGAEVGNVSFTLLSLPAFRVTGIVVDDEGKPIAGAFVSLLPFPREPIVMGTMDSGRSGDDGRFVIDKVVAGTYRATAAVPIVMRAGRGGPATWSSDAATAGGVSAGVVGGVTGGVIVSGGGAVSFAGGGGKGADQATDVVVADGDVTDVRVVARRPQPQ